MILLIRRESMWASRQANRDGKSKRPTAGRKEALVQPRGKNLAFGTWDGNRTRMACAEGFSSHCDFRRRLAVRALDYAFAVARCAVGAPRLVSTPSHH